MKKYIGLLIVIMMFVQISCLGGISIKTNVQLYKKEEGEGFVWSFVCYHQSILTSSDHKKYKEEHPKEEHDLEEDSEAREDVEEGLSHEGTFPEEEEEEDDEGDDDKEPENEGQ